MAGRCAMLAKKGAAIKRSSAFQPKWIPIRAQKTRQNKEIGRARDSVEGETGLSSQ
jgi:hypothetical protein